MAVLFAAKTALFAEGRPSTAAGLWTYAQKEYLKQLDWLLMTYLFLIGLAYALAYRRESEARALNTSQLETRLVEAQLQALQRQLHPHFLFNTLNTVSGLIRTDPDGADAMIDRLGDLLRMTLHKSSIQEVSLEGGARRAARSTWRSNGHDSGTVSLSRCACNPRRWTRRCRASCCSRSSKTPFATASRPTRGLAGSPFTPTATRSISSFRCSTTVTACLPID